MATNNTDTNIDKTEIIQRLQDHKEQLEAIYESVEKTRKYFLTMLIANVVVIVLPLIAAAFIIPPFIRSYTNRLEGLL